MQIPIDVVQQLCKRVRYLVLQSTTTAGSGHPSSCLSSVELMTTLLFGGFFQANIELPTHPLNDRLIFSKGHAAPLLYSLYTVAGKLSQTELMMLRQFESNLEGHPTMRFSYTEAATGSLGQGLSVGVGMAINAKYIEKLLYKTFVLLGDSEMAEGSNWEAMQLASYYKLNNLIGIIDVNRLGQRGETMLGHDLDTLVKRVSSFGWKSFVINGHDIDEIANTYQQAFAVNDQPIMILAKTKKGKGVRFLEDKSGWHGKALTAEECQKAVEELGEIDHTVLGSLQFPPERAQATVLASFTPPKFSWYAQSEKISTREAYGQAILSVVKENPQVVVLDAEVSNSTFAQTVKDEVPEQFFEMFIAEQNMVGVALGLSQRDKLPFISTFAAFFTRAFDQIRMAEYSQSNIKFVGSHAGVSIGVDGASQMGLEDIALFRTLQTGVILYPSDANSTLKLVQLAAEHKGNVYIRTTREPTDSLYSEQEIFKIGGSKVLKRSDQDSITIVSAGITLHESLKAYKELADDGVIVRIIDLYSIQPLDLSTLLQAATQTKGLLVVEDHYPAGGIAEAIRSALETNSGCVYSLAVRKLPRSGKPSQLLAYEQIDVVAIKDKVREILEEKK